MMEKQEVFTGKTDCKFWLPRFLGIPHFFIFFDNFVYELLSSPTGIIFVNVKHYENWIQKRSWVYKKKIGEASKKSFDNMMKNVINNFTGKKYRVFWRNCYSFTNKIKKDLRRVKNESYSL